MRLFKNQKKISVQLTIKRMLAGLVCLGVIVVALLLIISLMSINTMADSQKRLSVISRDWKPAVQEIKTALETFIHRQGQIASAKTIKELSPFQERKSLELKYEESRYNLEKLIPIVTGADQNLRRLTTTYNDFLEKDAALLETVQKGLQLEKEIAALNRTLDETDGALKKNAELLAEIVNAKAVEQKTDQTQPENTQSTPQENITNVTKASGDLGLALISLGTYGRELLLIKEREEIATIQTDKIAQAIIQADESLEVFRKDADGATEAKAVLEEVEKG